MSLSLSYCMDWKSGIASYPHQNRIACTLFQLETPVHDHAKCTIIPLFHGSVRIIVLLLAFGTGCVNVNQRRCVGQYTI